MLIYDEKFIFANMMTYQQLYRELLPHYEEGEAKAVVRLLLEEVFNLSFTDILSGKLDDLSEAESQKLTAMMDRLWGGEPVQHVVGTATFMGRRFVVGPEVLIPRPETEELCRIILDRYNRPYCGLQPPEPTSVLDIGTGSGCIAVTLALDLWNCSVSGWDISGDALLMARENALRLGAQVNWELHDVLHLEDDKLQPASYDIIISNPPYICDRERVDMEPRVLLHEPATALFVPDDNPLLFYHAIAQMAADALRPGGLLAFEINPLYADLLSTDLQTVGWQQVEILNDPFGKQRFILARKNGRA